MSEVKQSTKKFQFSIAALNDVLTETKSVKKKLSPFMARFQKHQMSEIFETFSYLHKCMATPKSNLTYKFNSLFALKVLLDSSDYVLVNWIEIFFLPHIVNIAKYYLNNNGEGKNYFFSLGYTAQDDAGIQKMGFNYVLLAIQLIQVGAKVKPYRLFQSSFLEDKSEFTFALQQMIRSGFKPSQKLSFYPKQEVIQAQISKFQQNLNNLSEQFIDFYTEYSNTKLYQYLEQQHGKQSEKYDINIVQVIESGDLFVSSPSIQICKEQLKNPQSLTSFKNALNVFHRLMLNADYETFFVLNFEDTLKLSLTQVLDCDRKERQIKRGSNFLHRFKNPEESKRIYTAYLSNLQKWGIFASAYVGENENFLKKISTSLKQVNDIQLPPMQNFQLEKKRFQVMRQRNKQRSQQLSEQIEKKPSALEQFVKQMGHEYFKIGAPQIKPVTQQNIVPSKVNISSTNNITTPAPFSGRNENLPFAKKLNYIQQVLSRLNKEQQNYEANKAILLDFNATFEEQLLMVPQNVFDEFSQRAFGVQKDIQDAIKLGYKDQQIKIQQPKKVQEKVQVRKIESQVFDQSVAKSHKSIAKQQQVRQSKKQIRQPIIDTPVKKFDFDESIQKNNDRFKVEDLGYKIDNNLPVVNKIVQEKPQNIAENIQKTGYQQYEKQQSFSVSETNHKQNLGYEFLNESNKEKHYNHPLDYGYQKVEEPVQNSRISDKQESRSQQIVSNRSIRKTEDLSQSRKKLQQSSVKSNSKVEHFSPQSSIVNHTHQYEKSDFKKKNYEIHQQELDIPLQEHMNYNTSVNKPKQFKSLSANREIKSKISENHNIHISPQKFEQQVPIYQKKSSQPSEPVLAFSNVSSPLAMSTNSNKINKQSFNYEQDLQEEELLDQDEICPPHINPLEESFHDINEFEHKIKSNLISNQANQGEISFKNCFQTDKYILQRQQQKKNKMYWLQSDSTNLVKNILLKKQKNKSSKINIPQLLNEKNVKHQSEIKAVEEQKNSKIKQLQSKIKNLEKESQFMKTQLTQHIEEIKSLKASSQYDKQSVGQRGYLQDMQNITAQKRNSPNKFAFSASRGFKIDTSNIRQNVYLDPKGKLINSKVYKQYFQKFRRQKDKKMVLKSKDLLHKDKDIEIGFMSKKQGQKLLITLFVTPEKDIQAFYWTITQNEGLQIDSEPKGFISYIRARKQEKILLTVQVKRIHYRLPQIEFVYTIQQQREVTKIMLPCSFHKFFFIKEGDGEFNKWFNVNEKIIRGEQVPYSKRLLKSFDNLREYFQCMTVLNKGAPNSQGEICYGGFATYKSIEFPVRICIKPNQFLYIQGVNQSKDPQSQTAEVIQYYISLLTHLLMKQID